MRARTLLARVVIFLGVVLALLVVGMSAYVGYRENLARQYEAENSQILAKLETLMPSVAPNRNLKQMPTVQIDAASYVGVLEIPDLNVALPISASYTEGQSMPGVSGGTVSEDNLVIAAPNVRGEFEGLTGLSDGKRVTLRLVTGQNYTYEVASGETLSKGENPALVRGVDDWDLTLWCPSFSTLQINLLRLRRVA
ncbi:MAG: sortase [Atopobiaceae bacterium]|jgi:sortase A